MTHYARIFFEAVPIFAALIAIVICGKRAILTSSHTVRVSSTLATASATLMIAAQVSWSWTLFIKGDVMGTELANIMWTVFNTMVMVTFAYTAQWREK